MGIFVCAKCGCVENTALGLYWSKDHPEYFKWTKKNEKYKGQPLCSECMPTEYADGSGQAGTGEWHGKFEKLTKEEWLKKYPESAEYLKPENAP